MATNLSRIPSTGGNKVDLLIDGKVTFNAIFEAIDGATDSVWVQFFIIHDDALGRELAGRLAAAAKR